jgi:hypothetical protein
MNWENIIIGAFVTLAIIYLIKTLRKPKSNCGDNSCNCE